jgi:hypothetical protein
VGAGEGEFGFADAAEAVDAGDDAGCFRVGLATDAFGFLYGAGPNFCGLPDTFSPDFVGLCERRLPSRGGFS